MSLNDIKIHPQQIAELYADTLIEINAGDMPVQTINETPVQAEKAEDNTRPVKFLGANKKHILILTTHENTFFLPENEFNFLASVLKACGFTIEDVAILNLKKQSLNYETLVSFFKNTTTLLFGISPLDIGLPINFPQFQVQQYDKCTYIHAPALSEIEDEKELKMTLWSSLKKLFSL